MVTGPEALGDSFELMMKGDVGAVLHELGGLDSHAAAVQDCLHGSDLEADRGAHREASAYDR